MDINTMAVAAVILFTAPALNREIGGGGLFKTRVPVFISHGTMGALLALTVYGESATALYCSIFSFIGYPLFRQIFSPTPAMFAGHGRTDALPRVNKLIEFLSRKIFDAEVTDVHQSESDAVEYGVKIGGLVGFCKCVVGWGILGTLFISNYAPIFCLLGGLYGLIHYYWGFIRWSGAEMRNHSEQTTGFLIIAPNLIGNVLLYNGGLLELYL